MKSSGKEIGGDATVKKPGSAMLPQVRAAAVADADEELVLEGVAVPLDVGVPVGEPVPDDDAVADGLPCAAAAPAQATPGGKSAENVATLFNRTVPTALKSARRVA